MGHYQVIGHALEMRFGDAHFAISRASSPMSKEGIYGAIPGDDTELRTRGPCGELTRKRGRLGTEFLTVDAGHEFKRFPIADAVHQGRALIGWSDHHDAV